MIYDGQGFGLQERVFARKEEAAQVEFRVVTQSLPQSSKSTFYARLDETLESFGFAEKVRALCAPAYKPSGAGRPGRRRPPTIPASP